MGAYHSSAGRSGRWPIQLRTSGRQTEPSRPANQPTGVRGNEIKKLVRVSSYVRAILEDARRRRCVKHGKDARNYERTSATTCHLRWASEDCKWQRPREARKDQARERGAARNVDPMLSFCQDLLIIGRQVRTAHRGIIDLLAVDFFGTVHIIELKRDETPREVVAQALDYASWVVGLESEDLNEKRLKYRSTI